MSCEKCINANTEICEKCLDNPKYSDFGYFYQGYKPTCPYGRTGCVCDPAYTKVHTPRWYKELYGDKSVEEVMREECLPLYKASPDICTCYDDEDK